MENDWKTLATDEVIQQTIAALEANGINAEVVTSGQEAKEKVLEMLPEGAEVFTKTSMTTQTIGLSEAIDTSDRYKSVRNQLNKMDRATQSHQMQELGAAPDYVVGSIHAVTQEGHIFIASNTGSQLAADVYGASHVIWVVGTQKIVTDNNAAFKRIYEYVLPLESERARKAYGQPDTWNSFVSKLLIINREVSKERIKIIFVKELLGF